MSTALDKCNHHEMMHIYRYMVVLYMYTLSDTARIRGLVSTRYILVLYTTNISPKQKVYSLIRFKVDWINQF